MTRVIETRLETLVIVGWREVEDPHEWPAFRHNHLHTHVRFTLVPPTPTRGSDRLVSIQIASTPTANRFELTLGSVM